MCPDIFLKKIQKTTLTRTTGWNDVDIWSNGWLSHLRHLSRVRPRHNDRLRLLRLVVVQVARVTLTDVRPCWKHVPLNIRHQHDYTKTGCNANACVFFLLWEVWELTSFLIKSFMNHTNHWLPLDSYTHHRCHVLLQILYQIKTFSWNI